MVTDGSGVSGGVVGVVAPTGIIPKQGNMETFSEGRSDKNDGDAHISSHSGLSALLNAVSLQMSTESTSTNSTENDNSSMEDTHHVAAASTSKPKSETTPTMTSENAAASASRGLTGNSGISNFPQTLMTVTLDPDNSNIITWLPDGKYFCLREDLFRERVLPRHFPNLPFFDSFLRELCKWGFTMIDTKRPGIEVFRHPLFRRGDFQRCQRLKYDAQMGSGPLHRSTNYDSPASASPSPIPPSAMLDNDHHHASASSTTTTTASPPGDPRTAPLVGMRNASRPNISSDKSHTHSIHPHDPLLVLQQRRTSSSDSFKRRLSPTHQESTEELDAPAQYKQRTTEDDLRPRSQSDDFHGVARNITTQKLQLPVTDNDNKNNNSDNIKNTCANNSNGKMLSVNDNAEFVDQAVRGATHSIVTDAIEALLRDEAHTQKVFQANAEELSKSSLPGLVPISQELFATTTPPSRRASSASTGGGGRRSSTNGTASSCVESKRRASDTNVRSKSSPTLSSFPSPRMTTSSSSSPKLSPPSSAKSSPALLRGKLPARKAMLMKAMREHSEGEASSSGSHSP